MAGVVPKAFAVMMVVALLPAAVQADPLVAYTVVKGGIPKPLTVQPGDSLNGRKAVVDQDRGGCLSCHAFPAMTDEDFHGRVGPDLTGVAKRLNPAQLRLRIVDPKQINSETVMPAFYRIDGLNRVAKAYEGKPILTAQEVEDVVAYLNTLK
jgi:L-cysteine S-thiosulfotransferase